MSERQTGATPEQLEAAVARLIGEYGAMRRTQYAQQRGQVRRVARVLVPPDSRIIGPEQIEALEGIMNIAHAAMDDWESQQRNHGQSHPWRGAYDCLVELIGDGE